jgi:hypothetical protein
VSIGQYVTYYKERVHAWQNVYIEQLYNCFKNNEMVQFHLLVPMQSMDNINENKTYLFWF